MPATTRTPALLLSSEVMHHDRPLLALRLDLVYFNEDGELRNYSAGSVFADRRDNSLADLRITAQYDIGTTSSGEPYGWHVEFRDVWSVNLERAEAMVKTLRKVNRGLEKLDEKFGYAPTFAAYAIRVGTVLNVARWGYRTVSNPAPQWGDTYSLIYQIDHLVTEFDKRYGAKAEVVS